MSVYNEPLKEKMLVIPTAHVSEIGSPSGHTFVHYLSIIPSAHMFKGEDITSLQHTSLSD